MEPATKSAQEFWDHKILGWEHDKYQKPARLGIDVNASLKARMKIASALIKRYGEGATVVELGCGSGSLLPYLRGMGVKSYVGIDISPVAISAARSRAKNLNLPFPVQFVSCAIQEYSSRFECDLCFSLGFLDWLSDEEIVRALAKVKSHFYFHSFMERRLSLRRLLHRVYVQAMYGYRSGTYIPQARTKEELAGLLPAEYEVRILRRKDLAFGAFIHNLEGFI